MKIINRQEFLKMPEGTLYLKYRTMDFYELAIKGESLLDDWTYTAVFGEIDAKNDAELFTRFDHYEQTQESFNFNLNSTSRDGFFEQEEMYAIYETTDIQALINKLQELIPQETNNANQA